MTLVVLDEATARYLTLGITLLRRWLRDNALEMPQDLEDLAASLTREDPSGPEVTDSAIALTNGHSDLMTFESAAKLLGVSSRTVRRRVDVGALDAVRIGRAVRLRRSDVHAFIEGRDP